MKTLTLLTTTLLALGCASADLEADYSDELGTNNQAFSAKASTNYQLGVDNSDDRKQCNRTNPLQVCSLLDSKLVRYWIDPASFGPPGTGFNDEIYNYVEQLDNNSTGLSTWIFNETEHPENGFDLAFVNDHCPGDFNSVKITSFSCLALASTGVNLTEGVGVKGNYTTHADATVYIDMDDIELRTTTVQQQLRLLRHAAGHGTLSAIGLGGRTDSGADSFASRMTVDVNFSPAVVSSGEKCRAESYSATNNGQFNLITPACSGAD